MNKISIMKPLLVSAMLLLAVTGKAQSHGNRLSLGVGALYERGFDVTSHWALVRSMREALM